MFPVQKMLDLQQVVAESSGLGVILVLLFVMYAWPLCQSPILHNDTAPQWGC